MAIHKSLELLMARHKGLELLMAGHKGRIWKRNPGKTWGKAMGEWGVEVPANLTWIKIYSFISSVRKEIVGNSYKLLHYLKSVRRLRKQSFFCRVDWHVHREVSAQRCQGIHLSLALTCLLLPLEHVLVRPCEHLQALVNMPVPRPHAGCLACPPG